MRDNSPYLCLLEQQVKRYIHILEVLFGTRDPRFLFGRIQKSTNQNDVPQIYFPEGFHLNGGCVVNIQISKLPWENYWINQGTWQVAHECVHLLDPGLGGTNIFEEGLASWFQDEPEYHIDMVKEYISRPDFERERVENYRNARNLVRECMPELIPAVKELRSEGVRIRDISPDRLAPLLPDVSREKVKQLCTNFNYGTNHIVTPYLLPRYRPKTLW